MQIHRHVLGCLGLCFLAGVQPAMGQIPTMKPDSLRPGQAGQGAAACSATETSSCAQAAAKIAPVGMGESPLEENLRRLTDGIGGRITGSPGMAKGGGWGVAGFWGGGGGGDAGEKRKRRGVWGGGGRGGGAGAYFLFRWFQSDFRLLLGGEDWKARW